MNTITKIDRATGLEELANLWPTITDLAKYLDADRKSIETLLLHGQDIGTPGYVYRMTPAQIASCRAALREMAHDQIAMNS